MSTTDDREARQRVRDERAFRRDAGRYVSLGWKKWIEPSLWAVATYRLGAWASLSGGSTLRRLVLPVYLPLFWFVSLATGVYLPRTCRIGGGLRIWHFGCVVVHPSAVIGRDCTLRHDVTIGNRSEGGGVPVLGDDVDVGTGARILGAVRIGNRAAIGANAVVLDDVPDDHVAVGVPARIVAKRSVRAEIVNRKGP